MDTPHSSILSFAKLPGEDEDGVDAPTATGCKEWRHETKSYKVFQELSVKCPALGDTFAIESECKVTSSLFSEPRSHSKSRFDTDIST